MQAEDKHKALDQSSQARTDSEASKQYCDSFPHISTGYDPNCCLCYAGTRKENSSPNWEELYSMGILDAR